MKRKLTLLAICAISISGFAQNDKAKFKEYAPGFYQNFILRDVSQVNNQLKAQKPDKRFQMDQSGMKLPNDRNLYTSYWAQPTLSQGNTGTCWAFGGTSFFESEVKRIEGKEVKLSEMHTVYWEYVEKTKEFIRTRGKSHFSQGSQANAVTRMIKMHGAMPTQAYKGIKNNRKYYTHDAMSKEMHKYLDFVKANAAWNEAEAVETIKAIMDHYMGTPPTQFTYEGKTYTAETFRDDYLKINADDYVDFMSILEDDFGKKGVYNVPDNWWRSDEYQNIPLTDYMSQLNYAIEKGYTVAIGGDVSEAGFSRETNVALIPDFDIPSKSINDNARQFRFANNSSTDDHIMHIIGYYKKKGTYYYLVKDSSSGSRNVDQDSSAFGYYFMHEDYIKLKILTFTIHKDAVK